VALPEAFRAPIRRLAAELARGDLKGLVEDGRCGVMTEEQMRQPIRSYGRTLTSLPEEALDRAQVRPLEDEQEAWEVALPLWTVEEGESDLSLIASVRMIEGDVWVELYDLHVL
jgi:hypothetical protein